MNEIELSDKDLKGYLEARNFTRAIGLKKIFMPNSRQGAQPLSRRNIPGKEAPIASW